MAEYIDRDLALSFPFGRGEYDHKNANPHFVNGCETYKEWLEAIPAADVAPVIHAHWKAKIDPLGNKYHYCSACKTEVLWRDYRGILLRVDIENAPFCPSCGAVMDESEGEE